MIDSMNIDKLYKGVLSPICDKQPKFTHRYGGRGDPPLEITRAAQNTITVLLGGCGIYSTMKKAEIGETVINSHTA